MTDLLKCEADQRPHCSSLDDSTSICYCRANEGSISELRNRQHDQIVTWAVVGLFAAVLAFLSGMALWSVPKGPRISPSAPMPLTPASKECQIAVQSIWKNANAGTPLPGDFRLPPNADACLSDMARVRSHQLAQQNYQVHRWSLIVLWVGLGLLLLSVVMALLTYGYFQSRIHNHPSSITLLQTVPTRNIFSSSASIPF